MKNILSIAIIFLSVTSAIGQYKAIQSEVIGKGKPILFLPGFTTPGSIWKETLSHLKIEREAHLISYAGFNGIKPIEAPWYSSIKKEIIAYIKDKNLQEVEIIGHSMGGTLATDIAAELPRIVKKIILVDALPCMREVMMPGVPAESLQYESPYNKRILEMNEEQFKGMATMMSSNMTNTKAKIATVTNWILEADRKTYVYGYTDLLKLDLRDELFKVKAKALILGAPTYGAIAKETMEKQYANLAEKTIVMAPEGKHFIMFDQPDWFYKKINAFLTSE
ncbi:MAG: alpha/beta hydrolase [Flavobacteriaceae bacterium]|nr:alpha/beta hydrolase [Flavobacteriaceae bacterium]